MASTETGFCHKLSLHINLINVNSSPLECKMYILKEFQKYLQALLFWSPFSVLSHILQIDDDMISSKYTSTPFDTRITYKWPTTSRLFPGQDAVEEIEIIDTHTVVMLMSSMSLIVILITFSVAWRTSLQLSSVITGLSPWLPMIASMIGKASVLRFLLMFLSEGRGLTRPPVISLICCGMLARWRLLPTGTRPWGAKQNVHTAITTSACCSTPPRLRAFQWKHYCNLLMTHEVYITTLWLSLMVQDQGMQLTILLLPWISLFPWSDCHNAKAGHRGNWITMLF